jgi:hypothetical protein
MFTFANFKRKYTGKYTEEEINEKWNQCRTLRGPESRGEWPVPGFYEDVPWWRSRIQVYLCIA